MQVFNSISASDLCFMLISENECIFFLQVVKSKWSKVSSVILFIFIWKYVQFNSLYWTNNYKVISRSCPRFFESNIIQQIVFLLKKRLQHQWLSVLCKYYKDTSVREQLLNNMLLCLLTSTNTFWRLSETNS